MARTPRPSPPDPKPPTAAATGAGPATTQRRSTFREYFEALVIAALFLAFANTFVVQSFYIPSGSMETTLLIGDRLFVNRFIYGPDRWGEDAALPLRELRRGDIVIFRSPRKPEEVLVKRLIGLPGDTIEVARKRLYLNGVRVEDESFTQHVDPRSFLNHPSVPEELRLRDNFGPYTVPADHYFCLGDNRDQSYDSRFWGPVPRHLIQGRAVLIYWSYGGGTPDGTWHGWGHKIKELANTAIGFLTKTRWNRTFHLIR